MSERRVALISGGSRGLGAALVECCLGMGYRVATFSRATTGFIERLSCDHYRQIGTQGAASSELAEDRIIVFNETETDDRGEFLGLRP